MGVDPQQLQNGGYDQHLDDQNQPGFQGYQPGQDLSQQSPQFGGDPMQQGQQYGQDPNMSQSGQGGGIRSGASRASESSAECTAGRACRPRWPWPAPPRGELVKRASIDPRRWGG